MGIVLDGSREEGVLCGSFYGSCCFVVDVLFLAGLLCGLSPFWAGRVDDLFGIPLGDDCGLGLLVLVPVELLRDDQDCASVQHGILVAVGLFGLVGRGCFVDDS